MTKHETAIYEAIDAFQRTHRLPGLQHAQIRALLAEHLDRALPAAAVAPPTADRAAVIAATARACAEHLRDTYSDMWTADAARSLELHAARIERGEPTALLHRMADKAQQQPDTETQPATCAECDHPHAAHREGDDPVSPGQCSACPDDDAWHDYQADEKPSDHEPGSRGPLWILVDNEPPILPDTDETDGGVQP